MLQNLLRSVETDKALSTVKKSKAKKAKFHNFTPTKSKTPSRTPEKSIFKQSASRSPVRTPPEMLFTTNKRLEEINFAQKAVEAALRGKNSGKHNRMPPPTTWLIQ